MMNFLTFAELCRRIESVRGRLDTIDLLRETITGISASDLPIFVRLIQGKPFPDWSPLKLGIGPNLLYDAVAYVIGRNRDQVIKTLNSVGDLGKAVEEMLANKSQTAFFSEDLTLAEVYDYSFQLQHLLKDIILPAYCLMTCASGWGKVIFVKQ